MFSETKQKQSVLDSFWLISSDMKSWDERACATASVLTETSCFAHVTRRPRGNPASSYSIDISNEFEVNILVQSLMTPCALLPVARSTFIEYLV